MSRGSKLSALEVLGRVGATYSQADLAWVDLTTSDEPLRQWNGIKTMVTAGRSTTFVLQKLSSRVTDFKEWYGPLRDAMKDDPLMRHFNSLRTTLEKEGMPNPVHATIEFLRDDLILGTAEVAVGEDQFGLWVHGAANGPPEVIRPASGQRLRNIRLPDPLREHLGIPRAGFSIDHFGRLFLDYIRERIVGPAFDEFGHTAVP